MACPFVLAGDRDLPGRLAGCLYVRGTSFLLCRALLFRGFFGLFGLLRLGAAVGFGALGAFCAFFLFSGELLLF